MSKNIKTYFFGGSHFFGSDWNILHGEKLTAEKSGMPLPIHVKMVVATISKNRFLPSLNLRLRFLAIWCLWHSYFKGHHPLVSTMFTKWGSPVRSCFFSSPINVIFTIMPNLPSCVREPNYLPGGLTLYALGRSEDASARTASWRPHKLQGI